MGWFTKNGIPGLASIPVLPVLEVASWIVSSDKTKYQERWYRGWRNPAPDADDDDDDDYDDYDDVDVQPPFPWVDSALWKNSVVKITLLLDCFDLSLLARLNSYCLKHLKTMFNPMVYWCWTVSLRETQCLLLKTGKSRVYIPRIHLIGSCVDHFQGNQPWKNQVLL